MQTLITEAIEKYHELLTQKHVESTVAGLADASEKFQLTVVGRPVCNVLRPLFLDQNTYNTIRTASNSVMRAFRILSDRLMSDTTLRNQLRLTSSAEQAIQIDTGFGAPDVSARLDGFLGTDGSFSFVEYNADSPGGIGFGDVLASVFQNLPILQDFSRFFKTELVPVRQRTFDALLHSYHRWGGKGLPAIAIVDWHGTSTYNEFLIMEEHFRKNKCSVVIVDPSELEFQNGILYANRIPVQLVYKRVVAGELIERCGLSHPLIEAVRTRAVCMANGLAVHMLFNKMLFAFLSDPLYAVVPPEYKSAIDQYIPWTRVVRDCNTTHHDRNIDLLSFIEQNRERFVLKPASEYGGKGVTLGWTCSSDEWNAALKTALDSPHVVQEKVSIGSEVYPSYVEDRLVMDSRYFDLDPYIWKGTSAEGCGVRLSRAALLNVSAGGGSATPMFIISKN